MSDAPYTREELASIHCDEMPSRGQYCEKCGNWIPAFQELNEDDERAIRAMESTISQIKHLRDVTGCRLKWAKIWVQHPTGPNSHLPELPGPCTSCGTPLRTALAQQCFNCGADWHGEPPQ
jgi:hypothetical protein